MIEILIDDDNKLSTGLKSKMDVLFNRFNPSIVQVKFIDDKEWV